MTWVERMTPKDHVVAAVLYALREGCFFPVPRPLSTASLQAWIQWGAMRHLHDTIAALGEPMPLKTPLDCPMCQTFAECQPYGTHCRALGGRDRGSQG